MHNVAVFHDVGLRFQFVYWVGILGWYSGTFRLWVGNESEYLMSPQSWTKVSEYQSNGI